MVPTGSLYQVIVNGMAYPTDLPTLRQWVQQGRVRPETLVGKGTMKPIPAREVPALRDCFAQAAPPSYAAPTPPSYAPPQPQNSGYSPPYASQTQPPPSYAPPSGGFTQPYAPPSNPQLQNSGYSQPYTPATPPSPPAYPSPQPQNSGYSQPYASQTQPPPSYAPPSGGYGQAYAPPSNPQLQNSGYSQPYTTAPSLNAPTPPPKPPASQTMAPLQPFQQGYSASGYSQPYAQPVSAPAYGAVSPFPTAEPFPNEFHKQDSRYVDAMKKIKAGWITGVVLGVLTFLIITVVVWAGVDFLGISALMYIDVLIIFGLAFGIFFKSRTCAVLMVVYYIVSKLLMIAEMGAPKNVASLALPIAITIIYIQAVVGTFKYHELKAEAARGQF